MRVLNGDSQGEKLRMEFSKVWHVLGPFQIGTREATWGVDPLEQYGGFANLQPDDKAYASSLAIHGETTWSTITADALFIDSVHQSFDIASECYAAISFSLAFPNVHWSTSQAIYGWSALQWQAWARGTLSIHGSVAQTVRLSLPGILEFELDGERHFGGDFFAFNRASLVQTLQPGVHTVNVRVIRDVRAMGAIGEPIFKTDFLAERVDTGLTILTKDVLFPDFVVGYGYASNMCSIPVQNTGPTWLEIVAIDLIDDDVDNKCGSCLALGSVAPGQTRAFSASVRVKDRTKRPECITISITYHDRESNEMIRTKPFVVHVKSRQISEPLKMVFRVPNGTASYCLLQAPCSDTDIVNNAKSTKSIPIMVVLHGADVEIDGEETREMLGSIGNVRAWIVVPSGGSKWSADDWHTWGLTDAQAAIEAVQAFIDNLKWTICTVDIRSIYVVGHSNGGQGTWHVLTHMPDRIRAAAPVSGYSSIQKYVPYDYEREVDPRVSSMIQAALTSYRHEILIDNAKGIPIQQQHGSADDNVPASHSRRMYQLLKEVGASTNYNEIPNKGHWYSGVMATPPLKDFYHRIAHHNEHSIELPSRFSIIIPSTGDLIGSRGGIIVEQLYHLGQLGRVDVERASGHLWNMQTSNVQRLRFGHPDYTGSFPKSVQIDDDNISLGSVSSDNPIWVSLGSDSHWEVSDDSFIKSIAQRSGMQFGTINAIVRQKISIVFSSDLCYKIALQVSRNLLQYYSICCEIIHASGQNHGGGSTIVIEEGMPDTPVSNIWMSLHLPDFPIELCRQGLKIKQKSSPAKTFRHRPGLGAIYLAPKNHGQLQLVIWGYDKTGLEQAARLAPGLTGVGQADFIIFGPESPWKGAGGALAMGFFDSDWSISRSSYVS